ncbi:hypothetical protein BH09BAC5_BH09BAC5_00320 [soil metagenome]
MKKIALFYFMLLFALSANAQTKINEAIGGPNDDEAIYATPTVDGGYVIVGWTTSYGIWGWDIYLAKTDSTGNILWTKTYGANGDEVDCFVQQTSDNGFIITARSNSFGAGSADVYLIKTNSVGDLEWSKTIGGSNWEEGHAVLQTADGGYIHCGFTKSFGAGGDDYYVIKNDANGNLLWTKTYGGSGDEPAHFIQQTLDGGFIVGGATTSFGNGGWDYYLVKIDSAGNQQWSKTYGGAGDDQGWSVQQTSDGGYIIGGFTNSFGAGAEDYWMVKTDVNGIVEWSKTYGGINSDECYSVRQTSDGGYVLAGSTTSFGAGSTDIYLIKTDAQGNAEWTKTYGGTGDEMTQCVSQMTDGGYLIGGYTSSFGSGSRDFYLIKTDSQGNSGGCYETTFITNGVSQTVSAQSQTSSVSSGGILGTPQTLVSGGGIKTLCTPTGVSSPADAKSSLSIYPNPANGECSFNFTLEQNAEATIEIFNAEGKLVESKSVSSLIRSTTINISSLANGTYFCKLISGGKDIATKKLVVQN